MTDDSGDGEDRIQPIALAQALGDRYLSYALSTIMSRSLPDVRDGLKPVHRRLLYAMRQLRLEPGGAPKKCARVVGDVIGQYHPHGDQSVYEALVRLAQNFAARFPLIDGQGNFGNIDGDNAAAMRYTEARLTEVARALLEGIDEDSVDFRTTYDDEGQEPVVLPGNFPNLLANGSQGIAVGMATSIPPHNVGEICDALTLLIERGEVFTEAEGPAGEERMAADNGSHPVGIDELLAHIKGPDFPTGGELVEGADSLREAYVTGRGSLRLRARWTVERQAQGQFHIVVYEVPYQVAKARLIEKIADLINGRQLPMLNDVRDESTEDVRIVLEPRSRNVEPEMLMEHLFRKTDLEVRIGVNMNVLDLWGVPRIMNLKGCLQAFLAHRHTVLQRRSQHRLDKIIQRLEVLDGYLIAYLNIDEVIAIIREEEQPKPVMMERFGLTDTQAEAILNMRLRSLRKLEEFEIRREHEKLTTESEALRGLLSDEQRRWQQIAEEVVAIKASFGQDTELGRRRTLIGHAPSAPIVPIEALVEKEPITVFLSKQGWIRAVKGHQQDTSDVKYKDGDEEKFVLHGQTTDRLLLFASTGRFYTLGADKLPRGRGYGEPVRLSIDLPNEADIVTLLRYEPDGRLLLAADDGRGFIVAQQEVVAHTKAGRQVLSPGKGARAAHCLPVDNKDMVAILGTNHKLLVFPVAEISEMAKGRGMILQKFKEGKVHDIRLFNQSEGLRWGRRMLAGQDLMPYQGKRAGVGRLRPRGFSSTNGFG